MTQPTNNEGEQTLAPCPFCASEMKLEEVIQLDEAYYYINCDLCEVGMSDADDRLLESRWNKRAQDQIILSLKSRLAEEDDYWKAMFDKKNQEIEVLQSRISALTTAGDEMEELREELAFEKDDLDKTEVMYVEMKNENEALKQQLVVAKEELKPILELAEKTLKHTPECVGVRFNEPDDCDCGKGIIEYRAKKALSQLGEPQASKEGVE